MNRSILRTPYATALVVLVLAFATTTANAQRSAEERRARQSQQGGKANAAVEVKYPNATREEPPAKTSARVGPRLQRLLEAHDKDDLEGVQKLVDEIIANTNANEYDKSMAYRILGSAKVATDAPGAIDAFTKALETNGLGNNDHFEVMWIIAQLQAQEDNYDESIAMIDRLQAETGAQAPEQLGLKGQLRYQQERYQEAAEALQAAIAAADEPRPEWSQALVAAYVETGNGAEAVRLAEQLAANAPDDRRSQLNLAGIYIQNDQEDKAIAVYERMRAAGQLTEASEYRNLMLLYLGAENQEQKAIAVINEGLEKGILPETHETYSLLGQAYYFSDQMDQAIEAYRKAAPLAPDGEAYLNLAKTLWAEGRIPEAKQAAQQALDKGVKSRTDAQTILKL